MKYGGQTFGWLARVHTDEFSYPASCCFHTQMDIAFIMASDRNTFVEVTAKYGESGW